MKFLDKKLNISIRVIIFVLLLFFVILIYYGGTLNSALTSPSDRFYKIKQFSIFLSKIPSNLKYSELKTKIHKIKNPEDEFQGKNKMQAGFFLNKKIEPIKELLLVPRFDANLKRNVIDIRRIYDFKLLHTFKPNIKSIHKKIPDNKEFSHVKRDWTEERYTFFHPNIDDEGNLIFKSESPLVKTNFCGEIQWVNLTDNFHHSIEFDDEGNILSPTYIFPSKLDKKYFGETVTWDQINVNDDSITKVNKEGETIYQKSIIQILLENNYKGLIMGMRKEYIWDVLHINDIQPATFDSKYWKKNDLFLSAHTLSIIIHYRPSTNKVIDIIFGPFSKQHDIDIISDKEISIFNNNTVNTKKGTIVDNVSEIIIYNFENKTFKKKFDKNLKKLNFKAISNGLHEFLSDGSIVIEDTVNGRLIYLDKKGEVIWEFVNGLHDNNYRLSWFRLITDKKRIDKINSLIKNKKCN